MQTAADIAYSGRTTARGRVVMITGGKLTRELELDDADNTGGGGEWGRPGLGSLNLSRAMLLDATHNPMLVERLCRSFTWEVIVPQPESGFEIKRSAVIDWVEHSTASQPFPSFALVRAQVGQQGSPS